MTKRFETKFDTDRERSAIETLLSGSDWTPEKLGPHDVDFIIRDADGIVRASCEVKGRNKNMADAFPLPLAARKAVSLSDMNKGRNLIVWACYDGIIYADINELQGTRRCGSRCGGHAVLQESRRNQDP
jgi:hypothetical protein